MFFPQIQKLLNVNEILSKAWQKFSFNSLNDKFLEKRSLFLNKNPSKSSDKIPLLNNPNKILLFLYLSLPLFYFVWRFPDVSTLKFK